MLAQNYLKNAQWVTIRSKWIWAGDLVPQAHYSWLSLAGVPKPQRPRMLCRNFSRSSGVMCRAPRASIDTGKALNLGALKAVVSGQLSVGRNRRSFGSLRSLRMTNDSCQWPVVSSQLSVVSCQ